MAGNDTQRPEPPLIGCIEGGGTKWNLALARDPQTILARERVATTSPADTLGEALAFFDRGVRHRQFRPGRCSAGLTHLGPDPADAQAGLGGCRYRQPVRGSVRVPGCARHRRQRGRPRRKPMGRFQGVR